MKTPIFASGWIAMAFAGFMVALTLMGTSSTRVQAQDAPAAPGNAAADEAAPTPLTEDELEVLVARIALYPDDLVALISSASLYPLQVVEAARFLKTVSTSPDQKPKASWDGSIVSLLNYPEIVTMMSDDLDWTQALGDALTYQQKDVLVSIQQLREEAVAKGIIKTDDKVTVSNANNNVIIESTSPDKVYVPQYAPEMLYTPDYQPVPIAYYPDPYPNYYYPSAPYFAGVVTGVVWGAAMDWNRWGVWGGNWGGDVDIDCNNCFNNINGKIKMSDVDWKNVDRSKLSLDRTQFTQAKRESVRNNITANENNSIRNKATQIKRDHPGALPNRASNIKDVRADAIKARPADGEARKRAANAAQKRPAVSKPNAAAGKRATHINHPVSKAKPAARIDNRPRKPSGLGEVHRGKSAKVHSNRGSQAMHAGGRSHHQVNRARAGRR